MKTGIPRFVESQRSEILEMLRAAGPAGVSKETLLFEKRWSQAAARIFELEKQGFQIAHLQRDGETYVRFVLQSEPLKLEPLNNADWYERTTGSPEQVRKVFRICLFFQESIADAEIALV